MSAKFTVVCEGCICAPEDCFTNVAGVFDTFDEAVGYIEEGKWCGDVARIKYNNCEIAYKGDYDEHVVVVAMCPVIEDVLYPPYVYDGELPF